MTIQRLNHLRAIMDAHELDAVALVPGPNLRYLTGGVHYMLEHPIVWLLPINGEPVAVIPQLEVPLFSRHRLPATLYPWTDKEGFADASQAALTTLNLSGKTIGVEGGRMRFFGGNPPSICAEARVVQADEHLAALRLIKDDEEIQALCQAVAISEQALTQTLAEIKIGQSEREIAARLNLICGH